MFQIRQRGSTVWREVLGGLTTFMAMSYIIFVQVTVLAKGPAGMDVGGVMMATCIAAGAASILMGLLANYPIALAPGMGENFYFSFTMCLGMVAWGVGVPWQMALAMTALAGMVFLLLSFVNFRARLLDAVPDSLKSGIAAGIGLFIAVIGFKYGGLVIQGGALVDLPDMTHNVTAWVALIGLDSGEYGTHSLRRTKATLIYRRTKNLRAVQLLLGHANIQSTVKYLGLEVDDALEIAEHTEI